MKNIPDYNGDYAVDENGNVYSLKFGKCKKLKPGLDRGKYYKVGLFKNGKMKMHAVHRLVAMTFLDDFSEGLQVDHINGDKQNNKLENLRMVTGQQNQWNRTKAKGYSWDEPTGKWRSQITLNNKSRYLGLFDTEQEARDAYLKIKKILHII